MRINWPGFKCDRAQCGHEWPASRENMEAGKRPKVCPRCKSAFWDRKPDQVAA